MDLFGPVRICSDAFGHVRMHTDAFQRVWANSENFRNFGIFRSIFDVFFANFDEKRKVLLEKSIGQRR